MDSSELHSTSQAADSTHQINRLESANTRCATTSIQVPLWKRSLDILCIFLALPVLIPVSLFIALLIKARSTGPVLFKQERVGLLGQHFTLLKFRTMVVGANPAAHKEYFSELMKAEVPMEKMDSKGDARLIPLGRLLRVTGLDELPQLINVLRGEMSLVGPRPCLPYEARQYLPWQKERFNVVPGLTGLWQVSGKNHTTFTEMIRLDIAYTKRATLWLDLTIIFKTIPALMSQAQRPAQPAKPAPTPAHSAAGMAPAHQTHFRLS